MIVYARPYVCMERCLTWFLGYNTLEKVYNNVVEFSFHDNNLFRALGVATRPRLPIRAPPCHITKTPQLQQTTTNPPSPNNKPPLPHSGPTSYTFIFLFISLNKLNPFHKY